MACSSEDGTQNYAKLMRIQIPCISTLKTLLEYETLNTVTSIDQLLQNNKKKILRDVRQHQQVLLFPIGNQPTDVDTWDISLFCYILRNCCMLQPTQDNDVNAVRSARNEIAHSPKPCISNIDYAKHTNVFMTFITNTLNYINDQDLKKVINEQVHGAKRPISEEVIEAYKISHNTLIAIADDVKDHIDEKNEDVMQKLELLEGLMSRLPNELHSKLKPPDLASFKLLVKECSPDEEKKISQVLVQIFGEELGKKCSTLSDDTCDALKDVVGVLVKRLQEKAELIDAEYGCVCISTRFYNFLSYMNFLDDLVNGKLTKLALPLQNALRCCYGIEDLQVELVMEDEQFLHCFENTLDCVKNVYSSLMKTTREKKQGGNTLPGSADESSVHSDSPVIDVPDIIMSTFYNELDMNSDLTLSKNDADKYGKVLKDAIQIFIAGKSQRQAPAVGAEREIIRLTKDSIKTEEESNSTTEKHQLQSNPEEAEAIRLTKQNDECVDELMLQKETGEEQSPWVKAEEFGIRSKEQTFGIIDEALLHQGKGHVQFPALEKEKAAEGNSIKESTEHVDEDLLPKEVTVREIEPLVRFDQESYSWSPKNQKLEQELHEWKIHLRKQEGFRILVAVSLMLTVLVAFKYMVVAFEVAQIRSHINEVYFGRSTCRQLEASGLSFDYLMHTDTQSERMIKYTDLKARLDKLLMYSTGHLMRTPTDLEQRLDLRMHNYKMSKWLSILADSEHKLDLRMHTNTLYAWICKLADLKDRLDKVASYKMHFLMPAVSDLQARLDKLAVYLPDYLIRTLTDLQERLDILAFYKLGHLMRTSADLQERLDILAFYKLGHLMRTSADLQERLDILAFYRLGHLRRTSADLQGKYTAFDLMGTLAGIIKELDLRMDFDTLYALKYTLADLKHPLDLWIHIHKLIEWQRKVADIEHTLRMHTNIFRDKMSKFADQEHTSDLRLHENKLSVRISNLTVADEERIWLQERLSGDLMRESAGQLKETQNWSRCVKSHERTFCGDIIMLEKDSHIVCGLYEWSFVVRHVET